VLIPAGVLIKKDSTGLPGTVPAIRIGRADDLYGTDPLPLKIRKRGYTVDKIAGQVLSVL